MSSGTASPPPLKRVLVTGSLWMLTLRWVLRLLGVLNIAILARLLAPEDFGLVAMATAIVGLSKVFFELGVDYALIRKTDATPQHFNAAWTIRLVQSLCLAIVLIAIGPLASDYYDDKRIELILQVIAIGVFIQGLGNIGVVSFRKDLEFNREFHYVVTSKLLSTLTVIALAFLLRSYWALVIGIVATSAIDCAVGYFLHPFRPKFSFKAAGDIWSFSKWMVILHISNYVTLKFDRILLGGLVSPAQLGKYTVGTQLSESVTTEIVAPVSRAIVPGLAKLQNEPKRLRSAFLRTISVTALITIPAAVGLSLTATEVEPFVLGDQWYDAIAIAQIASLHLLFATLVSSGTNLSVVTGHIAKLVPISILRSILFLALFYPAFTRFGIIGVLYLKMCLAILWTFLIFNLVSKTHQIKVAEIVRQIVRPAIAAFVMAVMLILISSSIPFEGIRLLASKVVLGALTYVLTVAALWRLFGTKNDIEGEIFGLLRKFLKRVVNR